MIYTVDRRGRAGAVVAGVDGWTACLQRISRGRPTIGCQQVEQRIRIRPVAGLIEATGVGVLQVMAQRGHDAVRPAVGPALRHVGGYDGVGSGYGSPCASADLVVGDTPALKQRAVIGHGRIEQAQRCGRESRRAGIVDAAAAAGDDACRRVFGNGAVCDDRRGREVRNSCPAPVFRSVAAGPVADNGAATDRRIRALGSPMCAGNPQAAAVRCQIGPHRRAMPDWPTPASR